MATLGQDDRRRKVQYVLIAGDVWLEGLEDRFMMHNIVLVRQDKLIYLHPPSRVVRRWHANSGLSELPGPEETLGNSAQGIAS